MPRTIDHHARRKGLAAIVAAGLCVGLLGGAPSQAQTAAAVAARADFSGQSASGDVRRMADWVVVTRDNVGMPFVIIDKVAARVFVFDAQGHLSGAAPALVGLTPGDDIVPGIGDKPLSAIGPKDRITPAGRFVASLGQDLGQKDVLWVDYKAGVALHRVITTNPKEHRLQRLAAASPLQHRISYGCINVPAAFYDAVVDPAFARTSGVVYILPETRPLEQVFALAKP
ncbi:L,D-transpeptidase [Phenylobacterium sp.]|uniref:L,D-transpeptidase n=1 Tax=Phenylobacterium sp. TaxID=1871053 RepID=UPI00356AA9E4